MLVQSYSLFEAGAGLYNMFHTERMYSGSARSNLSSPEVDKVLDEINITSDAEKRAELVGQAQELIHEESPFIYIAFLQKHHRRWKQSTRICSYSHSHV